ncbi:MAG: phosphatidylserine decarboxylase family protein [Phycisphaeraceae bacterium]|nr:phosphatidylserine decarboxylase family protein [Phycisphaeraceae bacterium]
MLSRYGKRDWLSILAIGGMLMVSFGVVGWWWAVGVVGVITLGGLLFFRDPKRRIPTERNVLVSPADGRVSSIHWVEHFEGFGERALCVRIFLSVLDVHVNRCPCHAKVESIHYKPGGHLNALKTESAQVNESNLLLLFHPTRNQPVAAVKQIAGMIARRIVCGVETGQILQRGQRFGMIKFGSTTELYVPESYQPQALVEKGQRVYGGLTALVKANASPASVNAAESGAATDMSEL